MYSTNPSGYRMRIKFIKISLFAEQNNFTKKVINVYIVYDLDTWPRNPTNKLKFKNYLFATTNIIKYSD